MISSHDVMVPPVLHWISTNSWCHSDRINKHDQYSYEVLNYLSTVLKQTVNITETVLILIQIIL